MDSTSVYGLELLVMEGTGKALATDHREKKNRFEGNYRSEGIL